MALERPPAAAKANMAGVLSYRPAADTISGFHIVMNNKESWGSIAKRYEVPVERLIACNFPGAVVKGKIVPEIVNWYLGNHNAFKCPETSDKKNRRFRGGEEVAIPLLGRVEIGEPDIIRVKKPTKLTPPAPNDHDDVIPGQKFSHEFRIPPKGEIVTGYFMYYGKVAIEGEVVRGSPGKMQFKKDGLKVGVETKFEEDLKGGLAVRFEQKYLDGVIKAVKNRSKAEFVKALLAPFEASLKEKYEGKYINFTPEVTFEVSKTPVGFKAAFDTAGPLFVEGFDVEGKFGVKLGVNVGLSPAGWAKVLEKVGPQVLKQFLQSAGAELAAVWEYLVAEGIIAGGAILAAAAAAAVALTALMAWTIQNANDKGELLGLSTWYSAGYVAKVFNDPRPGGFITGDTKMRDELVILGEQDAVTDGRGLLREIGRAEATASDGVVLLAYRQILIDIEGGNESEVRRKLRVRLNEKARKIVGLD